MLIAKFLSGHEIKVLILSKKYFVTCWLLLNHVVYIHGDEASDEFCHAVDLFAIGGMHDYRASGRAIDQLQENHAYE